jgi:hypothetical protein
MPDPQNLYQDLKKALDDFKKFLDDHAGEIKPVIGPLDKLLNGRVFELLDKLVDLLTRLKGEINNLNLSNLGGTPGVLNKVTDFTNAVKTLLETSKNLLPNEAGTIDEVLNIVQVVGGLPSVDAVKKDITDAIDAIITHLKDLKA